MKQVVQHNRTGRVSVQNVPSPALRPGFVLVRAAWSLISAGTERASIENRSSSMLERAKKNPDQVAALIDQIRQFGLATTYRKVKSRLDASATMGYSMSGMVAAVGEGVDDLLPGDPVACAGAGYASHAEYVLVPKNLCAKVPPGLSLEEAAYTTVGAIALQGIRQTDPQLGSTVVVLGLGLLGQITLQLLKANGVRVVGIDLDARAVQLAASLGADLALRRSSDVARTLRAFTAGRGADAVIITAATPSNDPVKLAGEVCREKGRVVLVGDVGLQLPRGPYFMKELDFRLSRSYGPGRYDPRYEEQGQDYPVGYVRWTERRNMQEFIRLLSDGALKISALTTHRFPVEKAERAFRMISEKGGKERYVGILLSYNAGTNEEPDRTVVFKAISSPRNPLGVGFIGAGSFAQTSLLPHVKQYPGARLIGVCNASGLTATNVASAFGFAVATTDPSELLQNDSIGTVFIASRHNLHTGQVIQALNAGKNVFVEKPLALNISELERVVRAYRAAEGKLALMVGFNRRFAPDVQRVRIFFEDAVSPFVFTYRINAGLLPSTHWSRDPVEGGGRIIGELCHFIDLMQYIAGAHPLRVHAEALGKNGTTHADDDSVVVTVTFDDGSVGSIVYQANAEPGLPKEYLEISSTGRSAVIDNFRGSTLFWQGKQDRKRRSVIDKGHGEEVRSFLRAIAAGSASPIPFEDLVATTKTTFRIVEALGRESET